MKSTNIIESFGYAWQGISYTVRTQRNMRIHLTVAVGVILAGLGFGLTALEWAVIALTIGAVLAAEAANTAIESVVDLMIDQPNPIAGRAKDVAAAAVLLIVISAVFVGLCIFGSHLIG